MLTIALPASLRRLRWLPLLIALLTLTACSQAPTGDEHAKQAAATPSTQEPAPPKPQPAQSEPLTPAATAQSAEAAQAPADDPPTGHHGPNTLSDDELEAGWILLFDGESLFGWQRESDAGWVVLEDAITVAEGEPGLLRTTAEFSNFILRFETRYGVDSNSGVFLRMPENLERGQVATACYEVNIAPAANPYPTGSIVERERYEGELNWHQGNLTLEDFAKGTLAEGAWQQWEITAWDGEIRVAIDGEPVLTYEDPAPVGRGSIGLQFREGPVAFRNLKLKPLGLAPLFNGQDLAGWQTLPDLASEFTVTPEGYIHVVNGPGQLETEATFGDFVLQLECLVDGENLNSGIFYRSIPGERMNGYESQIHNGYFDGDRDRPADSGTGGIYRRQAARRVVADDGVWFYKTIVAQGPHVSVWVNGWQVTDWTDERPPAENPREGLRLEPGTIIIQGHDPTTNLYFRDFQAAELLPREPE